jgi:sugar lactone lactonase YvrE
MITLSMSFASLAEGREDTAGVLVATGKTCHYLAEQNAGKVYTIYPDGERQLLAEGFGMISGLAVSRDNSVYLISKSKKRLFRIDQGGSVQMVRKIENVPQAIIVDRDGVVKFITEDGIELVEN